MRVRACVRARARARACVCVCVCVSMWVEAATPTYLVLYICVGRGCGEGLVCRDSGETPSYGFVNYDNFFASVRAPHLTASHYPPPASCCLLPTPFFLPPTTHHSPLTAHRASLTTHHSPRTTHPSPLTPPRTTQHAPLTAHPSPLTTHHSPRTACRKVLTTFSVISLEGWSKTMYSAQDVSPIGGADFIYFGAMVRRE